MFLQRGTAQTDSPVIFFVCPEALVLDRPTAGPLPSCSLTACAQTPLLLLVLGFNPCYKQMATHLMSQLIKSCITVQLGGKKWDLGVTGLARLCSLLEDVSSLYSWEVRSGTWVSLDWPGCAPFWRTYRHGMDTYRQFSVGENSAFLFFLASRRICVPGSCPSFSILEANNRLSP